MSLEDLRFAMRCRIAAVGDFTVDLTTLTWQLLLRLDGYLFRAVRDAKAVLPDPTTGQS